MAIILSLDLSPEERQISNLNSSEELSDQVRRIAEVDKTVVDSPEGAAGGAGAASVVAAACLNVFVIIELISAAVSAPLII